MLHYRRRPPAAADVDPDGAVRAVTWVSNRKPYPAVPAAYHHTGLAHVDRGASAHIPAIPSDTPLNAPETALIAVTAAPFVIEKPKTSPINDAIPVACGTGIKLHHDRHRVGSDGGARYPRPQGFVVFLVPAVHLVHHVVGDDRSRHAFQILFGLARDPSRGQIHGAAAFPTAVRDVVYGLVRPGPVGGAPVTGLAARPAVLDGCLASPVAVCGLFMFRGNGLGGRLGVRVLCPRRIFRSFDSVR